MSDTKFLNPYKGCYHADDYYKATVKIPRAVFNRLAGCRLAQGTIEITLALLIEKFVNELDKRNITDIADAREYEMLAGHSRLTLEPESCSSIEHHSGAYAITGVNSGRISSGSQPNPFSPGRSTPQGPHATPSVPNVGRGTPRLPSKEPLPQSVNPKPKGSPRRGSGGRGGSAGKTKKGEKE